MQNKDKGDGIEDSPLDMLLVILLEEASKEVVTPSSEDEQDALRFISFCFFSFNLHSHLLFFLFPLSSKENQCEN